MTRRVWVHDPRIMAPEAWPEPCPCPDRMAVRVLVDGVLTYGAELPRVGRSRTLTRVLVARSARLVARAVSAGLRDPDALDVLHYIACPSCEWVVICYHAQRGELEGF